MEDKSVEELILDNLRNNFNRVVDKVLGENYYNYGCDAYSCDKFTCDDLIYRDKELKKQLKLSRLTSIGLTVIILILSYVVAFC